MARTVQEIKQTIITSVQGNDTLKDLLTSTSQTSTYNLWAYIVAVAIWVIEKLFDTHKSEVESIIATRSPHRETWYKNKALAFQYGYSLPQDSDVYETIDEEAKIVAYAAVKETVTETSSILKVKVAKDSAGSLAELFADEKAAFTTYMNKVKDAGVVLRIISQEADHLRLVLDIYYDPLVLDSTGARLDGTNNTPAQSAITSYLENLPFNGEFSIMSLTDALQLVNGIVIPQVLSAEAYYGTFEWSVITAKYIPEAGWLKIYDNDLIINWKAYGDI